MRVVSLASGSKGNACVIQSNDAALLIDCGIGPRVLAARMKAAEIDIASIRGVLITHSHSDHIGGLKAFVAKRNEVAVYANVMTAESVAHEQGVPDEAFVCFENGQDLDIEGFSVHPFSIPHDTSDPVGYLIGVEGHTYFHGTDIGTPLDSIGIKLSAADIATLESNHDASLLSTSGRAPSLIQRIRGPRGHLSNDQAAELVARYGSPRLKYLALAHLSHDCNVPHLAVNAMRESLAAVEYLNPNLVVLSQDEIIEVASV